MGEPLQLTLDASQQQRSPFGNQFQLTLDPSIQAELDRIRFRLQFDELRSQWYQPDWSQIAQLVTPVLGPPPPPSPIPLPSTVPPISSGSGTCQLTPPTPGRGPETPRRGEASDVLQAVWALPEVKCAVGQLQNRVEHDWNRLGTGGRALLISTAVVLSAGAISGIANNDAARVWTLEKLSGTDIPIPKTGVSFRLIAPRGVLTGGGLGYSNDMFQASAGFERMTLPDGAQFNSMSFTIQVNMLEAIPGLRTVF